MVAIEPSTRPTLTARTHRTWARATESRASLSSLIVDAPPRCAPETLKPRKGDNLGREVLVSTKIV